MRKTIICNRVSRKPLTATAQLKRIALLAQMFHFSTPAGDIRTV